MGPEKNRALGPRIPLRRPCTYHNHLVRIVIVGKIPEMTPKALFYICFIVSRRIRKKEQYDNDFITLKLGRLTRPRHYIRIWRVNFKKCKG